MIKSFSNDKYQIQMKYSTNQKKSHLHSNNSNVIDKIRQNSTHTHLKDQIIKNNSQFVPLISLNHKQNFLPKLCSQRSTYRIMKKQQSTQLSHKYSASSILTCNASQMNQNILKKIQQKIYPLNKEVIRKIKLKREFLQSKENNPDKPKKQSSSQDLQNTEYILKKIQKIHHKRNIQKKSFIKQKRTKTQEQMIELQERVQEYVLTKRKQLQKNYQQQKFGQYFKNQNHSPEKSKRKDMKQITLKLKTNRQFNQPTSPTTSNMLNLLISQNPNSKSRQQIFKDVRNIMPSRKNLKKKSTHHLKSNNPPPQSQIRKILKLFKQRQTNMTTFEDNQKKCLWQSRVNKSEHKQMDKMNLIQKSTQQTIGNQKNQRLVNFTVGQVISSKSIYRRQGIKDNDGQMKSTFDILTTNKEIQIQGKQNHSTIKSLRTKKNIESKKKIQKKQIILQIPTTYHINTQQNEDLNDELIDEMVYELLDEKNNLMRKKINHGKLIKGRKSSMLSGGGIGGC